MVNQNLGSSKEDMLKNFNASNNLDLRPKKQTTKKHSSLSEVVITFLEELCIFIKIK